MKQFFILIGLLFLSSLAFGIEYSYGDTLDTLKAKNPELTFKSTGLYQGHQFETLEGQYLTTTKTSLTFDGEWRLFSIVMTKNGAALDVYEPLVEKYSKMYGTPKESTPLTTNLGRGISSATCSWDNIKGGVTILLVIPLDGNSVPWIMVIESYKYDN
jgi:hypothetical protein